MTENPFAGHRFAQLADIDRPFGDNRPLGPFMQVSSDGSCYDVESLESPIEVMVNYESEPEPLFVSNNRRELNAQLKGGKRQLDKGEMLAIHSTGQESADAIKKSGFSGPEGSGFGSDVRANSIFFWIHVTDVGVLGGFPYVVSAIDISESYVSDFDTFHELEKGEMSGKEYDNELVTLEHYIECLSKGSGPGEGYTMDTIMPFKL